jgi:hypothetical protein
VIVTGVARTVNAVIQLDEGSHRAHTFPVKCPPGVPLAAAAAFLLAIFLAIYAPVVGQGFVADDFGWVNATRPSIGDATVRAFNATTGFYRPLVSVSFAVNHELSGLDPRPYGLANLGLLLVCAALVAWLSYLAGLAPAFCLFAAALFAFNPHGVDMAVLWVSGRTGLLLTMFALAAGVAFFKRKPALVAFFSLCAMFSKEEAVVLPLMFFLWNYFETNQSSGRGARVVTALHQTRWLWAAAAVYTVLRLHSGALWPTNAPWYYRFSANPQLLVRNAREYADRACSLSALTLVVVWALVRVRPSLPLERRVLIRRCTCWLLGGFALTIFLPVRSSLYALFPSVGAVIIASTVIAAWWQNVSAMQKRGLIAAAMVLPLALFPVYRSRGARWIVAARLSSSVTTQLVNHVAAHGDAHGIVLQDDRSTRANLANAIGPAATDVASLFFERPISLRIEPDRVTHVEAGELLMVLDGQTGRLQPAP